MVTTPTPLAETIARVAARLERALTAERAFRLVDVEDDDLTALLACARRCEAIDRADGLVAEIRSHRKQFGWANTAVVFSERWAEVVDAAAERDALAKRVGELEDEERRNEEKLAKWAEEYATVTAEADRLRAENERLATLTAAQERVRELEAALSSTVRALHEHGHKQEASTFYRYLPPLGTSKQPDPITDPAQGAGTVKAELLRPSGYSDALDRFHTNRPEIYPRLALRLERRTNRHAAPDGLPWGWYEVFPLGITVGYWGPNKDDLAGVDLEAWNIEARAPITPPEGKP